MDNEEGWRRLARMVKARRDERGWTQLDLVNRSGLSLDRVQAIEGVRTDRYSARTLAKLERGLEWESGSVRAVLSGGDPTPFEQGQQGGQVSPFGSEPIAGSGHGRMSTEEKMEATIRDHEIAHKLIDGMDYDQVRAFIKLFGAGKAGDSGDNESDAAQ